MIQYARRIGFVCNVHTHSSVGKNVSPLVDRDTYEWVLVTRLATTHNSTSLSMLSMVSISYEFDILQNGCKQTPSRTHYAFCISTPRQTRSPRAFSGQTITLAKQTPRSKGIRCTNEQIAVACTLLMQFRCSVKCTVETPAISACELRKMVYIIKYVLNGSKS